MNITGWKIYQKGSKTEVPIKSGYSKPKNEFFVIETTNSLAVGDYEVVVTFASKVSTKLTGFYKSTYKSKSGETRYGIPA